MTTFKQIDLTLGTLIRKESGEIIYVDQKGHCPNLDHPEVAYLIEPDAEAVARAFNALREPEPKS